MMVPPNWQTTELRAALKTVQSEHTRAGRTRLNPAGGPKDGKWRRGSRSGASCDAPSLAQELSTREAPCRVGDLQHAWISPQCWPGTCCCELHMKLMPLGLRETVRLLTHSSTWRHFTRHFWIDLSFLAFPFYI